MVSVSNSRPKDKVIVGGDGRLTLEWDAYFSRLESRVVELESGVDELNEEAFPIVAFSARPSVTQTVASGAFTQITFGTEDFDTNGNFASSQFTVSEAGKYLLIAQTAIDFAGGTGDAWIEIFVNNGASQVSGNRVASAGNVYPHVSAVVNALVGTVYDARIFQSSAGNQDLISSRSYFCGFRLSS